MVLWWQFFSYWSIDSLRPLATSQEDLFMEVDKVILKFAIEILNLENRRIKSDDCYQSLLWNYSDQNYKRCKNRHIDQWTKQESHFSQLFFNRSTKAITWGKSSRFKKKWYWTNWLFICKDMNLRPLSHNISKMTSKWII